MIKKRLNKLYSRFLKVWVTYTGLYWTSRGCFMLALKKGYGQLHKQLWALLMSYSDLYSIKKK